MRIKAPRFADDFQPTDLTAEEADEEMRTRTWFLAETADGSTLLWVHTRGGQRSEQAMPEYFGRSVRAFPHLRCHVIARASDVLNPADGDWHCLPNLQGNSLFLGMNYPFMVQGTSSLLAVMQPDCVFVSHHRLVVCPEGRMEYDWFRFAVEGPAIGGRFSYGPSTNDGRRLPTPLWLVTTL